MTREPQGSALLDVATDVVVPTFTTAEAAEIMSDRFLIVGSATEVLSERDQIFLIDDSSGQKFILRVSGSRERAEVIDAQNLVLLELQRRCPEVEAPRLRESVAGRLVEFIEKGSDRYSVRALSYVDGLPIANRPLSGELLTDIGRSLALVDRALSFVELKGLNEDLIFNMERMSRLRPLVPFIERDDDRKLVGAFLTHLEDSVVGTLQAVRRQVIHNDLNGTNILTLASAPDRVAGIIDFGDIIHGALILDLAVAIARQVGPEDPVGSALKMLVGYNSALSLGEQEVAVLFDLVCARLAMRGLIWSWRKAEKHPRYHPGRIGNSLEMLSRWNQLGRNVVTDCFLGAIR